MGSEDRDARAHDYVLGLMDDEERRRAERDLIADPEFRGRVLALAERLRTLNREKASPFSEDAWAEVSRRLASLPQMGGAAAAGASNLLPEQTSFSPVMPTGRGAHQVGGRVGFVVALGLATAFAIGYLAGRLAWF